MTLKAICCFTSNQRNSFNGASNNEKRTEIRELDAREWSLHGVMDKVWTPVMLLSLLLE